MVDYILLIMLINPSSHEEKAMKNMLAQSMLMLVMVFGYSGLVSANQHSYGDDILDDELFDKDLHKIFARETFSAKLDGFQEVPAMLAEGKGRFRAKSDGYTLTFKLRYKDLSGDAKAAHIHFAQPGVNGGVLAWLCDSTLVNAPACPAPGEKLEGTIAADDVLAIPSQGVEAGDFKALTKAMKNGAAYINVHTEKFPAGEIRGNIKD
ncbi:CHRD domain-containing protein [Photobacterium sp. SDRW27]|uniref:CHRD domain-containing protein n=1 Tax=Photobacterium obscurum TaxID=2829490 RepID=UPI002244DD7B|nr:CHRD domain-containing protein [Photobacterium obscurum]MCW8330927.1 CHRD domain-containing protein [Photobacterium obscurum]